ncbi:CRISPR system Cascade subunit CasD [Spinactinospora alkalitolerans]|uniref:CRISPR system Cascade subunit CasD n=1 Tax=Spinactinospora alkalitolerans TaxID=687207 RepID=A0A852TZR5_9ACTN|nr:type I-E CRISPR-associated protein Cas5/CasD [Spinactinospora alkalitolerans]NYE50066.1 CRISPR system Cascade subunit CasD [Spinactinospora alkalitolerans]
MSGLLLRLAGPLQSWGEHSLFGERDTLSFPSRSGLLGLIAAAQGIQRGHPLGDLHQLRFTIRVDRPGVRLVDFHTIGGGLPRARTVLTADGKRQSAATATIVTKRHYLSDAVFTVATEGPDILVTDVAAALRRPRWQPFLGRRSCPPEQPLLLDRPVDDPVAELRRHVPVPRWAPRDGSDLELDFVHEGDHDDAWQRSELYDTPTEFTRHDRRYRPRPVSVVSTPVPAARCFGRSETYQAELIRYIQGAAR